MTHVQYHMNRFPTVVRKIKFFKTTHRTTFRGTLDYVRRNDKFPAGCFVQGSECLTSNRRINDVVGLMLVIVYNYRNIEGVVASCNAVDLGMINEELPNLLMRTAGSNNDRLAILDNSCLLPGNVRNSASQNSLMIKSD